MISSTNLGMSIALLGLLGVACSGQRPNTQSVGASGGEAGTRTGGSGMGGSVPDGGPNPPTGGAGGWRGMGTGAAAAGGMTGTGSGGLGGGGGGPPTANANPWNEGFSGCATRSWCLHGPSCTPPPVAEWPPGGTFMSPDRPYDDAPVPDGLTFTGVPTGLVLVDATGTNPPIIGSTTALTWNPDGAGGYLEIFVESFFMPDMTSSYTEGICRVPVAAGAVALPNVDDFFKGSPRDGVHGSSWHGGIDRVAFESAVPGSSGLPRFARRTLARLELPAP